jgi:putative heme iron utilization protein
MNEEHADAVELYATALKDRRPGHWRMTGIDPEGCDLLVEGEALRIIFAKPIATPQEAREELVRLTKQAREREV